MIYIKTLVLAVVSAAVMFALSKLMGNKQISQLNMFDYITGITIGSIASEMSVAADSDHLVPLIAMVVYGLLAFIISRLTERSIKARKLLSGKPLVLFDRRVIYKDNMKKARIDMSDLLTMCRIAGYPNLDGVETVVFEINGAVSVLPKSADRPLTPKDMGLCGKEERYPATVLMDGAVIEENLRDAGLSREWLLSELSKKGFSELSKVMLATVDDSGELSAFACDAEKADKDIFE